MKFKSIRNKLISRVSLILILSFTGVLSVVGLININSNEENLKQSEENIRTALIAKGRILVRNNSQALKGMVEDYAFSAVQNLVSSTVRDDADIVYGIYMDADRQPWVKADAKNPEGVMTGRSELEDEMSLWARELEDQNYRLTNFNNEEVYEFAAPVVIDEEIFGHIRYAISTDKMKKSLEQAKILAQKKLLKTLLIVLSVGVAAFLIGFMATRKMAKHITTPLGTLTSAAGTIAGGDYKSEVEVTSNDEIGLLAKNFDSMRLTIQKKMQDLSELNATGEILATLLDQNKALEVVLRTMHDHCKVNAGSVYLFNNRDELEVKAFYPTRDSGQQRKPIAFKVGEGLLGKTAESRKIIYVDDTSKNEAFIESNEAGKALICVPLLDKDMLLGVMNFSGKVNEVEFEESDYEYAESIARLLVITIKNIRMREVIEEQNRTLEQKVEERTAELQEKTNDILNMMQNMHQGLFTIMEGGMVHHEYATYLETIFETNHIANCHFMDLVFANTNLGNNALDQINTAVNALLGEDEIMFDFNAHILATEVTCYFDGGREKILELDWDPIILNGIIDKIMVTVRDVTELKALQAAAEEQKRELEIIGQILSVDPSKFKNFLTTSKNFVEKCCQLIAVNKTKNLDVISELFRNMHTVKGNARTYGFTYITDSVHDVESGYDELRKDESVVWDSKKLLTELDKVEKDILRYEVIARNKLGRSSETTGKSVGIDSSLVSQLLDAYAAINPKTLPVCVQSWLGQAYHLAAMLDSQELNQALAGVVRSVKSLARQLDKPIPDIVLPEQSVLVRSETANLLENIFMHLFRNAIDHGIESAEERKKKGKPEQGLIHLQAASKGRELILSFCDDGRGLAIKKIKQKGVEKGFLEADQADPKVIAELIFASGFSTSDKVSDVSGRGVGMDSVKKFLVEQGGDISIELNENATEDSDYCGFVIRVHLPKYLHVPTRAQQQKGDQNRMLLSQPMEQR